VKPSAEADTLRQPNPTITVSHLSVYTCGSFFWVLPESPAAKLSPGEAIKLFIDGVAHPGAVIMGPAPDLGVELVPQLPLRQDLAALPNPSKFREMVLHLGFGEFDPSFVPQTSQAPGAFARLVFARPMRPDVKL